MERRFGFMAYYGRKAEPPKKKGELAIAIFWSDRCIRDAELQIIEEREDIDTIVVVDPTDF